MNKKKHSGPKLIKCEFTSVWSGGEIVTTPCTYNPKTGEVSSDTSNVNVSGSLVREYITLNEGPKDEYEEEKDVCTTCHDYVMKTVIGDRSDESFGEYDVCSDPDCESNGV
jgi:hypothetical protein